MRYWVTTTVLFIGMLGILACRTTMTRGSVIPTDKPGPHFDHAGHMSRGIECSDCHGDEKTGWRAMPDISACSECHEDIDGEAPPEKRSTAFFTADGKSGVWTRSTPLDNEIIFDHGGHVAALGKRCEECHADVIASKGDKSTTTVMTMDNCMDCHERQAPQANKCESCHLEIRKDVAPASHGPGWKRAHGRRAAMGDLDPLPRDCALCHSRSDCDSCHRAEAPADHTNLWRLSGHGIAAAIDRDRCQVCHKSDSCFLCHQQMKPRTHSPTWGAPFNRHCYGCHLPLSAKDEGCIVCHKGTPSHAQAPPRPGNAPHMTNDSNACRACHSAPAPHPDNGQSCLACHH